MSSEKVTYGSKRGHFEEPGYIWLLSTLTHIMIESLMNYWHFHCEALGYSKVGHVSVVHPVGCLAFAETSRGRPCFFVFFWMGRWAFFKNQECKCSLEPICKQMDFICFSIIIIYIYIYIYVYICIYDTYMYLCMYLYAY